MLEHVLTVNFPLNVGAYDHELKILEEGL